jgi:hypothetical protein
MDGSTLLGTGTLVNGVATVQATFTTVGTQSLTAVYSGDSNNGSVSSTTPCTLQAVEPATISLTSSVNPSLYKQSVTFTATIASPGPMPSGTVKFMSGTTLLGSGTVQPAGSSSSGGGMVNIGVATFSYAFPLAGTYSITAVYSGDSNTAAVTSTALSQVVLNIATVNLTSALPAVLLDNQDVLTAVITSTGVTPTGLVTFYAGASPLGNAPLVNGTATLSVGFPITGNLTLTAVYYGDPLTAPATSAGVAQLVGDLSVAVAAGAPVSQSILAGGTAQYSLVLTPLIDPTLPSAVVFSVSGLPKGATASFAPATVATGSGVTPFVLTVNAPAIVAEQRGQPSGFTPLRTAPVVAALLLLPLAFVRRRKLANMRRKLFLPLVLVLLAVGATGLTGCLSASGSGYYGQTPQTYTLTVTATSGQLSRTTHVTLIVE